MLCMSVPPPKSEGELLTQARSLAGLTLEQLATKFHRPLPKNITYAKRGWDSN